jgi:hypothetical protein
MGALVGALLAIELFCQQVEEAELAIPDGI